MREALAYRALAHNKRLMWMTRRWRETGDAYWLNLVHDEVYAIQASTMEIIGTFVATELGEAQGMGIGAHDRPPPD